MAHKQTLVFSSEGSFIYCLLSVQMHFYQIRTRICLFIRVLFSPVVSLDHARLCECPYPLIGVYPYLPTAFCTFDPKSVPNDECVIDRLIIQSWINVMKQDWGDRINPTMNGGGRLVLIWGWTYRTMLVDKGNTLSGYKGTCTYEHGPKILQVRMARVWTNVYAYEFGRSAFGRAVSGKWTILQKRRPRFVCVPLACSF